jgi:hypothetical protein
MRVISQAQALHYLRTKGAPLAVRRALGDYSTSDPNTGPVESPYNEEQVFAGNMGGPNGGIQVVNAPIVRNIINYTTLRIAGAGNRGFIANDKRVFLLVQNFASSGSTLWVNFGVGAGVENGLELVAGAGILLDTNVGQNSVDVFTAGASAGIMIEGAPSL